MYYFIHQLAFYLHITAGAIALVIFWFPIIAKKGSKKHVFFGKIFTNSMYAVAITGIVMSSLILLDPLSTKRLAQSFEADKIPEFIQQSRTFAGFLLMLSVLVISNVRQSILVLQAKNNRAVLKSNAHLTLLFSLIVLALIMGKVGFDNNLLLFKIFSALSIASTIRMFHYIFKAQLKQREWILAHLGNIIGAGIAAYTAFFAFGGQQILSSVLTGNLAMLPWILPSVIGISASIYFTKKYRQQYRIA